MSTLPFDYARCQGSTRPECQLCRRREPGREQWQSFILPPINLLTGECPEFIEPLPIRLARNTSEKS